MLLMEAKCYFGLGLEAALAACNCFRKSLLMLASNFLVGTFFSSSLCCRLSIDGNPKPELLLTRNNSLIPLSIASEPRIHFGIILSAARTTGWCILLIVASVKNNSRTATWTYHFDNSHFLGIQNQFMFTHTGELL